MTRKEQLQEIEEHLKNGVQEYFTSEKYASLLRIMSKFHNYSFNNCVLIATQCPQASFVTGYNNWKLSFNRIVKRGEKPCCISHKKYSPRLGGCIFFSHMMKI